MRLFPWKKASPPHEPPSTQHDSTLPHGGPADTPLAPHLPPGAGNRNIQPFPGGPISILNNKPLPGSDRASLGPIVSPIGHPGIPQPIPGPLGARTSDLASIDPDINDNTSN